MGFGRYRFRRSFGQVASQFRGARPDTYPLTQSLLSLYPATAAYSAYDLGNKRGGVTESEGTVLNPVQRWRRGSDDALQMFTAKDIANGTALTWGGTTAYLLTEYDQSGNAYDLTQTTAANQPLVVSGGALTVDDYGNVAPLPDGVNDVMESSLVPPSTASYFAVSDAPTAGVTRIVYGARDSANERAYLGRIAVGITAFGVASETITGSAYTVNSLLYGMYNGTTKSFYVNGSQVETSAQAQTVDNVTHGSSMFAFNNAGTAVDFTDAAVAAVLVYDTDQSANRAEIEAKLSTIVTTAIS